MTEIVYESTDDEVIDQGNLILDDSDNDESLFDGNDSSILNSSGIDSDLEEFIISSIEKSSHQRSCPLNPRN